MKERKVEWKFNKVPCSESAEPLTSKKTNDFVAYPSLPAFCLSLCSLPSGSGASN